MKFLKWLLFVCISVLVIFSIFISAKPREIVARIDIPSDLNVEKVEIDKFDPKVAPPLEVKVNYEFENGVTKNIGRDIKLPLWYVLRSIESVRVGELRQGGRELVLIIETEITSWFFLCLVIIIAIVFLVVLFYLFKKWAR